jgi:hypothetical protein
MATTFNIVALTEAVAAVAPIEGVAAYSPGQAEPPGAHVVTTADGTRVRIDYRAAATAPQIVAGDAAAAAFSLTRKRRKPCAVVRDAALDWIAAGADAAAQRLRLAQVACTALGMLAELGMRMPNVGTVEYEEDDT